jgi:hypothetical protein
MPYSSRIANWQTGASREIPAAYLLAVVTESVGAAIRW